MLVLSGAGAARGGAASAPPGRDRTAAIVRRVLADRRYQTEMPKNEAGARFPTWWLLLPAIGLPKLLVYLISGVAIALVAVWLVDAIRRRIRSRDGARGEDPDGGAAREWVRSGLSEAERLAAEGRYSEAAHALLLAVIQYLARRPGARIDAASTSREILRNLPRALASDQRDALAELVGQVEVSWFGGRSLGAADYARCHRCCQTLVSGGT